jgi:hypothetical protein
VTVPFGLLFSLLSMDGKMAVLWLGSSNVSLFKIEICGEECSLATFFKFQFLVTNIPTNFINVKSTRRKFRTCNPPRVPSGTGCMHGGTDVCAGCTDSYVHVKTQFGTTRRITPTHNSLPMDSTFGTVIEETVVSMDVSQHDIVKFAKNYVHRYRPNTTSHTSADDSVDFDLSGVSIIATEGTQKDEEILKLGDEILSLKQQQEGMAAEISFLQDQKVQLSMEVEQLKGKVEQLVMEESVITVEKDFLVKELSKAQAINSHQEHEIVVKKRRIGELISKLTKFNNGVWFRRDAAGDAVGYGSVLNGEDVFLVKGSQMEWDETFHLPLFGREENSITNFVMLQKTDAGEGRTLVNAVGCQVIPDTLLEFRLNNREVAHFGF